MINFFDEGFIIDVNVAKDYHIYSSDTLKSPPGGETNIVYYES